MFVYSVKANTLKVIGCILAAAIIMTALVIFIPDDEAIAVSASEFDTVFAGYNELQKLQGLDLSSYKRKTLTRYTYEVTNYEGHAGRVLANLLIYRGRVVGGDICTESKDGFIHGFLPTTRL